MHNAPYTAKNGTAEASAPESTAPLPLRKEAPGEPACYTPQKDLMSETTGGKITNAVIYKGLGFVGNSTLSVGVTYWINPTKGAKWTREKSLAGAKHLLKDFLPQPAINNAVDIGFMLVAGTILTSIMAPLVNRREKIANWINKKLGKDADVLPEDQRVYGTPHTLEDKVELELKKRVRYGQTSRDLWKARWSGIWLPVFGDMALGKLSAEREAQNPSKWSIDTVSWKTGQHLYDEVLPKNMVSSMGAFFKRHGAGIEDVKVNNKEIYQRLQKIETLHKDIQTKIHGKDPAVMAATSDDRMMIADQTRLLVKEVGWTVILAEFVEKLTNKFQFKRIRKQEDRALAKMREEGIIPAGVSVETDKQGHVTLNTLPNYVPAEQRALAYAVAAEPAAVVEARKWADEKVRGVVATALEKSASHAGTVEKERELATQQPFLG